MNLTALTISQIRDSLTRKETSAEELVKAYLAEVDQKDKDVRAYLTLCPERAFEQARKIDRMIAAGESLPRLAGVPTAVKDVILTLGVPTT